MRQFVPSERARQGLIALATLGLGFVLFDRTNEIRQLKNDLATANARVVERSRPGIAPKTSESSKPSSGGNARVYTLNELFKDLGVTSFDISETRAVQRRQEAGEYTLPSESPVFRKLQQNDFRSIAADLLRTNVVPYDEIFSTLGLDPKVSADLQTHLQKIARASLESEVAEGQLLQARQDFDEKIRALTSPDGYAYYREQEALKPARMEAGNIQASLTARNAGLDEQCLSILTMAIRQANPRGFGSHGPYDPMPHVRMGKELVDWSEQQFTDTEQTASRVLDYLQQSPNFPPEQLETVRDYFTEKKNRLQHTHLELQDHFQSGISP